ncbi:MAG: ESX secretion-associated protein EspG [Gordonia sp. (in: high G+C Gram-positive bacteria)]|uniref:ESX secretion-associated protein EspG n=1 Tax=Gordonia sp. (in: high G+C Gram-positive bacteria) TaxID=84139 RepID=UPI0039E6C42C
MESVEFTARIVTPGEQLRTVDAGDPTTLAALLPLTAPADCQSIRVREQDLIPRLTGKFDAADILSALRAAGADSRHAQTIATVLGSATCAAEITAVDAERQPLHGAVAVFCSARGDVVSVPATAADGGAWLTIAPATARRVALGCADLAQRRRAVR